MRILCISYEYPPIGGGGAPVCERLCRTLADRDHEVDVLTSRMRDLPVFERRDGVGIYRSNCIRRHRHYTTTSELATTLLPAVMAGRSLIKENDYDLIHCHFVVPSGIVASILAKQSGLPYVLTCHGSDVPGYNPDRFSFIHKMIQPIWARIVGEAAAVTSPSAFLRGLLHSRVDKSVQIIPNSIHLPNLPSKPRKNRVLVVSRLFKRKGVQHLIDAFQLLDDSWELVIAGDGPYLRTLEAQAAGANRKISFAGFVTGDDLADLYASAKIFVLPSLNENFPVVLLEAMAAGCAVITTSGSGCAEVVGEAGILVPPEDPAALAASIQKLIDNERQIQRLQEQSLVQAAKFGDHEIARRFEELFRGCLDNGGSSQAARTR